ncbi:hypothetical protein TSEDIMI_450004 [Tenacibaculum sediminilitoris]|uniref:hypothetical protein n=1 Tax=Tenacibaculum sediminilitoris TaxID=1820334 RepID=UPI0038961FE2
MKKINKITNQKIHLIAIFLFLTGGIYSQNTTLDSNLLLGKWDSYKITTLDGNDGSNITFDGKPFRKKVMMNFISSEKMLFSINNSDEIKIKYTVKDSVISIGHGKYRIINLKDGKLVLKEEKLLANLIYLKKD